LGMRREKQRGHPAMTQHDLRNPPSETQGPPVRKRGMPAGRVAKRIAHFSRVAAVVVTDQPSGLGHLGQPFVKQPVAHAEAALDLGGARERPCLDQIQHCQRPSAAQQPADMGMQPSAHASNLPKSAGLPRGFLRACSSCTGDGRARKTTRRRCMMRIWVALTAIVGLTAIAQAEDLRLPPDYTSWHHAKTLVLKPSHPLAKDFGGIHHIYVNDRGWDAYLKGGPMPQGSVLIFDLYEAEDSPDALAEGKRKFVGMMKKTGRGRFNGWRYEVFAGPNLRPQHPDQAKCHACHMQAKDRDFVFSSFTHGR
ncbi:MAG: hypothetical protein D6771_06045, partial [Zetaproteobacteria bacterium]